MCGHTTVIYTSSLKTNISPTDELSSVVQNPHV